MKWPEEEGPVYGPYSDEDDWTTVYPPEYADSGLTDGKCVREANNEDDSFDAGFSEDVERLMWLNEVINDGKLSGEGTGTEIAGVVATMLGNDRRYGFEFSFYELLPDLEDVPK